MHLTKRSAHYHPFQILLHWLIAALIVVQYLTGGSIQRTHDALMAGDPPAPADLVLHLIHNRSGMAILLLMLLRLSLRLIMGVPAIRDDAVWRRHAASLLHKAFYGVLIGQAALGLTASYVYWPVSTLHVIGAKLLIGMIGIHILAACWHQLVRRDRTLPRILGRRTA